MDRADITATAGGLLEAMLRASLDNESQLEFYWDRDEADGFDVGIVVELWSDHVVYLRLPRNAGRDDRGRFDGLRVVEKARLYSLVEGSDRFTSADHAAAALAEFRALALPAYGDYSAYLSELVEKATPIALCFEDIPDYTGTLLAYDGAFFQMAAIEESLLVVDGVTLLSNENLIYIWSHAPRVERKVNLAGEATLRRQTKAVGQGARTS